MNKQDQVYTRDDVFRGGPGLSGYAWKADIWCEDCVKEVFNQEGPFTESEFKDSEVVPQPIFFGEHDTPQYCVKCNKYLYGGLNPKLKLPCLDDYDLVIVVEGGFIQNVASPQGEKLTVLLIDLDGSMPVLDNYSPEGFRDAIGKLKYLAARAEKLPQCELFHAEFELEEDE